MDEMIKQMEDLHERYQRAFLDCVMNPQTTQAERALKSGEWRSVGGALVMLKRIRDEQ